VGEYGAAFDEVLLEQASTYAREDRPRDPTVTVVIPALNEAENLPFVLARLDPWIHEVLLVDGASEDNTTEIALALHPRMRILSQQDSGKGEALRTGFMAATGDIIVTLDADGSADPAEIPAFVGALCAGADFAKGSRFLQGAGTTDMPFHRKLGNACFVMLVRLLFGGKYSDLAYGYNAFWRDVLPALQLENNGFEFEILMNIRALRGRLSVVEVASFESRRMYGEAKLKTIPDGWRVLRAILKERLTPLRAASVTADRPNFGRAKVLGRGEEVPDLR
jgi:glycosyltransferase involved in cell wall biosynthesis